MHYEGISSKVLSSEQKRCSKLTNQLIKISYSLQGFSKQGFL